MQCGAVVGDRQTETDGPATGVGDGLVVVVQRDQRPLTRGRERGRHRERVARVAASPARPPRSPRRPRRRPPARGWGRRPPRRSRPSAPGDVAVVLTVRRAEDVGYPAPRGRRIRRSRPGTFARAGRLVAVAHWRRPCPRRRPATRVGGGGVVSGCPRRPRRPGRSLPTRGRSSRPRPRSAASGLRVGGDLTGGRGGAGPGGELRAAGALGLGRPAGRRSGPRPAR